MTQGVHTKRSVQVKEGYVLNLFSDCGTAYDLAERGLV